MLASNAIIEHLQSHILLNIKGQYMKESNTLAVNVVNIFLRREVLIDIKGQYMKE